MQIVPLFWGYSIREDSMVLTPTNRILNQFLNSAGYYSVNITDPRGNQHMYQVHRLMAIKFVYNPVGAHIFPLVDHIDRNQRNNEKINLRWLNQRLNAINTDFFGCTFSTKWRKWVAKFRGKYVGSHKTYQVAHKMYVDIKKKTFEREYKQICGDIIMNSLNFSMVMSDLSPTLSL